TKDSQRPHAATKRRLSALGRTRSPSRVTSFSRRATLAGPPPRLFRLLHRRRREKLLRWLRPHSLRRFQLTTNWRQAILATLQANLPATAKRAIHVNQTIDDRALCLSQRILLQHLNLLNLRHRREVGGTGFVLQDRDVNRRHSIIH